MIKYHQSYSNLYSLNSRKAIVFVSCYSKCLKNRWHIRPSTLPFLEFIELTLIYTVRIVSLCQSCAFGIVLA